MNSLKVSTVMLNFTKQGLRLIKITKVLRVITFLLPILLPFLIPLDYSINFKWVYDGIAFIGCIVLLFWLLFSIILHYYPISYSINGFINFNSNNKSISVSNLMEKTNYYPIDEIEIIYSTRIKYKINLLISNYKVHNKFINFFLSKKRFLFGILY